MEGLLISLAALTPLNVALSIFGGLVFGFIYRNFYIDSRSIFLFILYISAFSLGRVLFVGVAGAAGGGLVGTILFLIYIGTTLLTRKFFRRNKRRIKIDGKDVEL